MSEYINLTLENLEKEHLCCAIGDKKHQNGVNAKKEWIKERLKEGYVFRKLNEQGKIFIEYAPLETAWVPIEGNNYMYIYCLWVAGSFKGKGYGKDLLNYCINDAKEKGKNGVCIISSKNKKPFLSDAKFMNFFGFKKVDDIDDYDLLSLPFNDKEQPHFSNESKRQNIANQELTIYYSNQCPYTSNCIKEIGDYCSNNNLPFNLIKIDSLDKAKKMPCMFTNWATFYKGKYVSNVLLNENSLVKLLNK